MKRLDEYQWNSSVSGLEPGAMESPLDVLSRAATLVETSSQFYASLNNSSSSPSPYLPPPATRSSPTKELSVRTGRQDRTKERLQVLSAIDANPERREHINNVKRTTSTQTQPSSFETMVPPPPPPPPPYYPPSTHRPPPPASYAAISHRQQHSPPPSYERRAHRYHHHPDSYTPSLPPALPPYPGLPAADVQQSPLNLSITAKLNHTEDTQLNLGDKPSAVTHQDESIEEHFRRSLGEGYQQEKQDASPPERTSSQAEEKICSVDDHFARALGDKMWTVLKTRSEEVTPLEPLPDAVDDHFAKALGANMWKKLKTEKSNSDLTPLSTQNSSSGLCNSSTGSKSLVT